jgi:hypothetical protein
MLNPSEHQPLPTAYLVVWKLPHKVPVLQVPQWLCWLLAAAALLLFNVVVLLPPRSILMKGHGAAGPAAIVVPAHVQHTTVGPPTSAKHATAQHSSPRTAPCR